MSLLERVYVGGSTCECFCVDGYIERWKSIKFFHGKRVATATIEALFCLGLGEFLRFSGNSCGTCVHVNVRFSLQFQKAIHAFSHKQWFFRSGWKVAFSTKSRISQESIFANWNPRKILDFGWYARKNFHSFTAFTASSEISEAMKLAAFAANRKIEILSFSMTEESLIAGLNFAKCKKNVIGENESHRKLFLEII